MNYLFAGIFAGGWSVPMYYGLMGGTPDAIVPTVIVGVFVFFLVLGEFSEQTEKQIQ